LVPDCKTFTGISLAFRNIYAYTMGDYEVRDESTSVLNL